MALVDYLSEQDVSTPAQTTNPISTPINLGDSILNWVELRIPPGHCGLTGWQLSMSGSALLPWQQQDTYIVGDDELLKVYFDLPVTTGLQIITFNDDYFAHTHYCRMNYTPASATSDALVASITPVSVA